MDIKQLIEIFSAHEIEAEKDRQEALKKFKENYPDEQVPAHMLETFNICTAFKVMCKEISDIKEKLGMK